MKNALQNLLLEDRFEFAEIKAEAVLTACVHMHMQSGGTKGTSGNDKLSVASK